MLLIILANGFIGASFGMIIFTSAIRSIPRASLPCRAGRRRRRARDRPPRHAAGDPLAAQLRHPLPGALAAGQLRVHLADHRRRAVLRHHRLRALRLQARLRERPVRLWRRAGPRCSSSIGIAVALAPLALLRHARAAAAAADRGVMSTAAAAAARRRRSTGQRLAARARSRRRLPTGLLYALPGARRAARSWSPISGSSPSPSPAAPAPAPSSSGARSRCVLPALFLWSIAAPRRSTTGAGGCGLLEIALGVVAAGAARDPDRAVSPPRQLALPVEPGHRRHAQGRLRRRRQVPERLDRLRQLAVPRAACRWRSWSVVSTLAGYYLSRFDFPRPRRATSRACWSCTPSRR